MEADPPISQNPLANQAPLGLSGGIQGPGLGTGRNAWLVPLDIAFKTRGPLPWVHPVRLPFLWIFGRRDATISVMGANIYPEDVETIIYKDGRLAARLHSFFLSVVTDSTATPRPSIALEINGVAADDASWTEQLGAQFQAGLAALNLDYRAARGEFPAAMLPIVELHGRGEGPFKADAGRIKQRRIAQRPGAR